MISFILINVAVDAGLIRDQILSVLLASRDTVYLLSITLATLSTHRPSDSLPVDLRHLFLDDVPRHHQEIAHGNSKSLRPGWCSNL
jgi:hypothetical protein